jgi:hypothetical protein
VPHHPPEAWESEIYACLVASAEYGLKHEPITLGICTNSQPQDAPDAPIMHYCQALYMRGGSGTPPPAPPARVEYQFDG